MVTWSAARGAHQVTMALEAHENGLAARLRLHAVSVHANAPPLVRSAIPCSQLADAWGLLHVGSLVRHLRSSAGAVAGAAAAAAGKTVSTVQVRAELDSPTAVPEAARRGVASNSTHSLASHGSTQPAHPLVLLPHRHTPKCRTANVLLCPLCRHLLHLSPAGSVAAAAATGRARRLPWPQQAAPGSV